MIVRLRITRRDSPSENANFTGFLNLLLLPLFHHREIEVMCIHYQRFVHLLPKPLLDIHAGTLSRDGRRLKATAPQRRQRSGWALSWAIYDAREAHPFCPPDAGNSVYSCPPMSTRRPNLVPGGLFVAATLVAICPPQA